MVFRTGPGTRLSARQDGFRLLAGYGLLCPAPRAQPLAAPPDHDSRSLVPDVLCVLVLVDLRQCWLPHRLV